MNNFNVRDDLKKYTEDELKGINQSDRLPFSVCLINLNGDLNIGTSIRTANVMGAEKVFILGKKRYDLRSTVGTNHYINIEKIGKDNEDWVANKEQFLQIVGKQYLPIMIETDGVDIRYLPTHLKIINKMNIEAKKPCFVFGSENGGIPQEILSIGGVYSIPQKGVIRNMNVSAAVAIALWEYRRSF